MVATDRVVNDLPLKNLIFDLIYTNETTSVAMKLTKSTSFTSFASFDTENEVNEVRRLGDFWLLRLFCKKNEVKNEVFPDQSRSTVRNERCVDTIGANIFAL